MATTPSVPKTAMPPDRAHVERWETVELEEERHGEALAREEIHVHARPFGRPRRLCPACRRRCPEDGFRSGGESSWRAPDPDGAPVLMVHGPQRTRCPEHGEIKRAIFSYQRALTLPRV